MLDTLRVILSFPFFVIGFVAMLFCLLICGEKNQKLIDEVFKTTLKKLEQYG